jgi:outer membrane lipoprotein-sorting protein
MGQRIVAALAGAALCAGLVAPGARAAEDAAPAGGPTADEIQRCVRQNLPSESSVQEITFRVNGKAGMTTDSHIKIHWQKGEDGLSKVLLRFDAPADMRGSALLLIEKPGRNDMFMYLPELKRVRRVTGPSLSGGMFGTDFTYSQFERLQGISRDLVVERLPDDEVDGTPVYVLGHTPADDPEFEYVQSYVDRERCIPLRTEFYESGRHLRKVLEAEPDAIQRVGEHWIPHRLVMKDVVQGTSTEFQVDSIDVNAKIHRRVFTEKNLTQGN